MLSSASGNGGIKYTYSIEAGNFTVAGEAASSIKKLLKQLGIGAGIVRKIAIAAYEAEMNLVIHSVGGNMDMEINTSRIVLIAEDRGPGIEDIQLAMQEGFSTAPQEARELGFGAGMGLANIKRCTDSFKIESQVGQGTRLEMCFNLT